MVKKHFNICRTHVYLINLIIAYISKRRNKLEVKEYRCTEQERAIERRACSHGVIRNNTATENRGIASRSCAQMSYEFECSVSCHTPMSILVTFQKPQKKSRRENYEYCAYPLRNNEKKGLVCGTTLLKNISDIVYIFL